MYIIYACMDAEKKQLAIKLRKDGRTYSEIQKELGHLPKSTLSGWLKNIELTDDHKSRIFERIHSAAEIGRQKGGWTNHLKRVARIEKIKKEAVEEYSVLKRNRLFLAGLTLFLAEGSKKTEYFQFMNSDPSLIKIMMFWLNQFAGVPPDKMKFRLYTHKIFSNENYEQYWSNTLNIPIVQFYKTVYKDTVHKTKKNNEYKGCLRLEVGGSTLYWKIIQWRDILYNSFEEIAD